MVIKRKELTMYVKLEDKTFNKYRIDWSINPITGLYYAQMPVWWK